MSNYKSKTPEEAFARSQKMHMSLSAKAWKDSYHPYDLNAYRVKYHESIFHKQRQSKSILSISARKSLWARYLSDYKSGKKPFRY